MFKSSNKKFKKVLRYLRSWPISQKANYQIKFPQIENEGTDLLDKLLSFDSKIRITAAEALAHPYLEIYHLPEDEPCHLRVFDFSFEAANTISDVKGYFLLISFDT